MKFLFWFFPELFCAILFLNKKSRPWVVRMIEDSDGDPNHTDGFFVAVLWCGTVCIRVACAIALNDVFENKASQNISYVGIFLTSGGALLGVRALRGKNLNDFVNKKKND